MVCELRHVVSSGVRAVDAAEGAGDSSEIESDHDRAAKARSLERW
jgi:hypothetical protein